MFISFIERHLLKKKQERSFWQAVVIDVSAVLLWRGLWGLMDLYIFPNHQETSFVFSAVLGMSLLMIFRPRGK